MAVALEMRTKQYGLTYNIDNGDTCDSGSDNNVAYNAGDKHGEEANDGFKGGIAEKLLIIQLDRRKKDLSSWTITT